MESEFNKRKALLLFQEGQKYHESGDIRRAIELYSQSLAIHPTAETHTCRGWAYSFQGKIDEAISECKRAIAVDPSLGNPYNDIGFYLLSLGKTEEAEEWLIKAKAAARYDLRHSPFMNLGRLYALRGMMGAAIKEFEQALELCPEEPSCRAALQHIRKLLN